MAADPIADLLDADGRPRWDLLQREPICSRCGYNLRLLEQPRCPECALEFTWRDVVCGTGRQNNEGWLFEYAWRTRPVRALTVTSWRALRPWSFWRRISIHDPIDPGGLLVLFAIVPIMSTVSAFLYMLLFWTCVWWGGPWRWVEQLLLNGPPPWLGWWVIHSLNVVFAMTGQLLFVGMVSFLLIAGLRQTMNRYRVRVLQLLRIAAYSAVPVQAALLGIHAVLWISINPFAPDPNVIVLSLCADLVLCHLLAPTVAVPLGPAYLNLPNHAWIAVLTSVTAVLAHRVARLLFYIWT